MMATPRAHPSLPTGTVTFLFTDIEGSTRLWETHHATMQQALAHQIMRDAIESNDGYLVETTGEGALYWMENKILGCVPFSLRAFLSTSGKEK